MFNGHGSDPNLSLLLDRREDVPVLLLPIVAVWGVSITESLKYIRIQGQEEERHHDSFLGYVEKLAANQTRIELADEVIRV